MMIDHGALNTGLAVDKLVLSLRAKAGVETKRANKSDQYDPRYALAHRCVAEAFKEAARMVEEAF